MSRVGLVDHASGGYCKNLERALREGGHDVVHVYDWDVGDALAILLDHEPEWVIVDPCNEEKGDIGRRIQEWWGIRILSGLRAQPATQSVRVIVLTKHLDENMLAALAPLGVPRADCYNPLCKDFTEVAALVA